MNIEIIDGKEFKVEEVKTKKQTVIIKTYIPTKEEKTKELIEERKKQLNQWLDDHRNIPSELLPEKLEKQKELLELLS